MNLNKNKIKKKCVYCGKEFTPAFCHPTQKYCSKVCGLKANYTPVVKIDPDKEREIGYICQKCGHKFSFKFKGERPSEHLLKSLVCPKCNKGW